MPRPARPCFASDVRYDAFLANDRTLDDPDVINVEKGGRVRLRIINGATATGFVIATPGLASKVGAFPVLAQVEDAQAQTGIVLTTAGAKVTKRPTIGSAKAGMLD